MTGWSPKRFWTDAVTTPCDGGFTVLLDAKPVRTPARALMVVPTLALAEAMAREWQAQTGRVDPRTMPFTRTANSAIDTVAVRFDEVASMLAAYGETDLLCYRATGPAALARRQALGWDPLLDWSARSLGAPLRVTEGVIHIAQPTDSLTAIDAQVRRMSPFGLAAFHDLVAISGSLILALAVHHKRLTPEDAWQLARIDESWQAEVWGTDEDAAADEALKEEAFLQADRFLALCG